MLGWGKSAQEKARERGQLRRQHHKRGAEVASHGRNDAGLKGTWELYLWPQSSGVIPQRRKT